MSLDTYTNLKASLADWLNRTDLTSQIVDFIALAETKMKRDIRKWTVYNAPSRSRSARVVAPTDLKVLRSIRLVTGSASQDVPFRRCTIEMLNERKARSAGSTGRPTDFAIVDGYLYLAPEPDQTYTAEVFYFSTFTALASASTNSMLTEAPDVYLYGALAEAEPYLEHDDRAPMWKAQYKEAVAALNAKREEDEFNASIGDVRLPVVFD
jgi:hypothetical protein